MEKNVVSAIALVADLEKPNSFNMLILILELEGGNYKEPNLDYAVTTACL